MALAECLIGAREAYSFHVEGQSKEALKSLGDLRKGLQDEVARTQTSTRDLILSLWRNLGIAGVMLALKSPMLPQIAGMEALRWVTLVTSALLPTSLCVSAFTNARFSRLADLSSTDWRRRLYSFVSPAEWKRLVDVPIKQGRRGYRFALAMIAILYSVAAGYLFSFAEPETVLRIWSHLVP